MLCIPLTSQAQLSFADSTAITETMLRQQECWNKGDLPCFMVGYWESDSLRYIGSSGIKTGWQETLDRYKETYPDKAAMGELTFTHLSMEYLSPIVILVVGKWHLRRVDDELQGLYTLIWKKMDHQWVIVYDHSS